MTSFPVAFDPGLLPPHWRSMRLRFLATHLSRGAAPSYSEDPTELRVVNQACIHWDGFHPENVKYNQPVEEPSRLKGYLRDGDLLVNSTGEGTVGRSLVFRSGDGYVADGHVTVVRFRDEMDADFVSYVINTPAYQDYLDAWFILGATKQTELTGGRFKNAVLPVPPVDEQSLIVNFVRTHDGRVLDLESLVARLGAFQVGRAGLLADRRHALITAAVTGQIEIDSMRARLQAA